jgi:hypothetical protein
MKLHTCEHIAKILGIKFENQKTFEFDVELQKKTHELDEITKFMKDSMRTDIFSFLNKLKKLVTQFVETNPKYQEINEHFLIEKNQEILSSCINRTKSFERKEDANFHYCSFDMSSANFASLKLILGINQEWADFLYSIVPNDERGNSSRNKKLNVIGNVTSIPNIFYHSKFVRTYALSGLDKLRLFWEHETLLFLQHLNPQIHNWNFCFKSDEIIIQLDGSETMSDFILSCAQEYPKIYLFKQSQYFLTLSPETGKNCLCKKFIDGSEKLIHGYPKMYLELLRKESKRIAASSKELIH